MQHHFKKDQEEIFAAKGARKFEQFTEIKHHQP